MNSIDKSLVTFDLALRRRFAFCKIMPQLSVLESMLAEYNIDENVLNAYISRCKELNDRISNPNSRLQLGVDYQIGHAYFAKIKDFLIFEEEIMENDPDKTQSIGVINSYSLEKLWMYHLLPLLEEYLGSRIDDAEIQQLLKKEEEIFTKFE